MVRILTEKISNIIEKKRASWWWICGELEGVTRSEVLGKEFEERCGATGAG